jgi:hypothetical protein
MKKKTKKTITKIFLSFLVPAIFWDFYCYTGVGASFFRTKLTNGTKGTKELLENGYTLKKGFSNNYFNILYFVRS